MIHEIFLATADGYFIKLIAGRGFFNERVAKFTFYNGANLN